MATVTRNILIGGEAGQGLLTVAQLLTKSLVRAGYHIVVTQSYQSRIRGGHNTFAIRVSTDPIGAPQETIDLLVAFDAATVGLHRDELKPDALIVADEELEIADGRCLSVPLKQLASGKFVNTAALGVVSCVLGLSRGRAQQLIEEAFGKKMPDAADDNERALGAAFEWTARQSVSFPELPAIADPPRRLTMNGNDAVALGAVSAGVKFCSFYPMTPATSISLDLAARASQMGLVVEQAEDEMAAINMAIGASFAGAPSMVATSGGGFSLMAEGVSLAGMTETPVFVVVGQRPGPATGLPTRTEQADLLLVLHAGHGEFPRAIFAPGSIEECFHLTRQAVHLAERYQTPTFLLTDQFLADSYRAVEPFGLESLPQVAPRADGPGTEGPYERYAVTESGVSPRLLPGATEHLVVADSDEHTPDGHMTEDLQVRVRMNEKRLRKLQGLSEEAVSPEAFGDENPELLLVCWGSTKGSVAEAAERLRETGRKVAVLHFAQVWPLIPDHFLHRLERAAEVVCIEGNATGQFADLIRRETGLGVGRQVLRCDGLPHTPESILRDLEA